MRTRFVVWAGQVIKWAAMQTPQKPLLIGATIIALLTLGVLSQVPSVQGAPTTPVPVLGQGRFQLTFTEGDRPYVFLLDTQTGRCWMKTQPSATEWTDITPTDLTAK